MSKLCVIATGGTIGSVLKDGAFAVEAAGSAVGCEIQAAAKDLGYEVEIVRPLNKNSESLAPADWSCILQGIKEACDKDVDGIVVLHGTDTMEYSLAAASCFAWPNRVCFTGAMVAPELASSDAPINLTAAMSLAANRDYDHGVYLAFRTDVNNATAGIFHASEVKPLAFDESYYRSLYNQRVANYSLVEGLQKNANYSLPSYPVVSSDELPDAKAMQCSQDQLAYIKLYPGLSLSQLKAMTTGRSIVIVELYHSGTGPTSDDYRDLVELLESAPETVFFGLSAFPSTLIDYPYASTQALIQAGAMVYGDVQPHYLYVFCLLMTALGQRPKEIKGLLQQHAVSFGGQ